MSEPTTIREHLQMAYVLSAGMCKEAEKSFKGPKNECAGCDVAKHLEAALELLNFGDWNVHTGMTTIPDPLPDRTPGVS